MLAFAFLLISSILQTPSQTGKTIWDGVYTEAQARRGETAFIENCVRCHKENLEGVEGALRGEAFMERRREDNLETFYLDMRATMPRAGPRLADDVYADLVAYVLQANAFPAGHSELKPEVLESIHVVGKDGPKPIPNFAPVSVVGCLIDTGPNTFLLINADEPVRTRSSFDKIEKESKAALARTLGEQRFRLQDAENFEAAKYAGQKALVKGILVRSPTNIRINVNYIEELAPACQ